MVFNEAFHVEACLALCSRDIVFSVISIVMITSLVEERADLRASRALVC